MEWKIKALEQGDLEELLAIERVSFSVPWSRETYQAVVGSRYTRVFVAFEQEKIVGYIGLQYVLEIGDIVTIAVHPEHRKKGLGDFLMDTIEGFARRKKLELIFLEVRESNLEAQGLYQKKGFQLSGRRANYYTNPQEDALVMYKDLVGIEALGEEVK